MIGLSLNWLMLPLAFRLQSFEDGPSGHCTVHSLGTHTHTHTHKPNMYAYMIEDQVVINLILILNIHSVMNDLSPMN